MDKKDTGKDKLKKALKVLKFEEIKESKTGTYYSEGCSGNRSDCCTRVCTRVGNENSEEDWGKFLEIEGGVVQY
ncbi:MAG: hypothetical protein IJ523_00575 [Succinivibrionaceae bacterium]|nr:hypothetical protein [Succinivibrionaceae bacterium]